MRALFIFIVFLCSTPLWAQQPELPNIVVFISDDLGRLETSIHGSPDVKTPMLDELAREGMVFENAYVASPSCCPNRYSLLTGLMPARHGAHPNHSRVNEGTKFLTPLLKQKGYHLASFGKVAHGKFKIPGADYLSRPPRDMSTNIKEYFAENEIDQPVCLFVGDRRPHVIWTDENIYNPDQITLPPYFIDTPETREIWCRYLSDITGMDQEVRRVYQFAQKQFGDNFVFLFTSDHGGQWPFGKWNLYDHGTRIPLVVRWPAHIKPNSRTQAMVSWVDILPTLIDITGHEIPDSIDGVSFKQVLLGETSTHRPSIFTTHTGDGHMNIFPMRSVRKDNFKLVHNLCPDSYHTNHTDRLRREGAGVYWHSWDQAAKTDPNAKAVIQRYHVRSEYELFDLDSDPLEQTNLADKPQYADKFAELQADLKAWTEKQGDQCQPHQEPYPINRPIPKIESAKIKPTR